MRKSEVVDISDISIPMGLPKVSIFTPPTTYEIAVSMFDKCNLRCHFCFQEHTKNIDTTFIDKLPDTMVEASVAKIRKYEDSIETISLLFMGGELFSDDISVDILLHYQSLWIEVRKRFQELFPTKKIKISVSTNGVWKLRHRIVKLLKDSGVDTVNISYDPVGRYPNEETRTIVHDTVKYVHDAGFETVVGFVTTKGNIQKALDPQEPYLKMLQSQYVTYGDLNMYIGNIGWEQDMPNSKDMSDFFKWCLDNNLWKINFINRLMTNYLQKDTGEYQPRYCDCKYETCISQYGITSNCAKVYSPFESRKFYGEYSPYVTEDNVADVKALIGVKKLGCLNCEHMSYCPMPCWCATDFVGYRPSSCPILNTFNYISEAHVRNFEEWGQLNG